MSAATNVLVTLAMAKTVSSRMGRARRELRLPGAAQPGLAVSAGAPRPGGRPRASCRSCGAGWPRACGWWRASSVGPAARPGDDVGRWGPAMTTGRSDASGRWCDDGDGDGRRRGTIVDGDGEASRRRRADRRGRVPARSTAARPTSSPRRSRSPGLPTAARASRGRPASGRMRPCHGVTGTDGTPPAVPRLGCRARLRCGGFDETSVRGQRRLRSSAPRYTHATMTSAATGAAHRPGPASPRQDGDRRARRARQAADAPDRGRGLLAGRHAAVARARSSRSCTPATRRPTCPPSRRPSSSPTRPTRTRSAPAASRTSRHPAGGGAHPRRARPGPGRRHGGPPPRHPRGHRVLAGRHRGALRAGRRPGSSTASPSSAKFSTLTHEQQQAENIRKMFLAMAEDIRVVLIKLADRLHNMRTLGALPPAKQQRIARQTAEIYAPLAERLGIWQIKWELEDLSFKFLDPDAYRELASQLESHRKAREAYVQRAMEELHRGARRRPASRPSSPAGPSTSTASTRRCAASAPSSARSTTSTPCACSSPTCASATRRSGVVHSLWRPIPGQFDDYIAMPKNNMYQSLHTAVVAARRQAARGADPLPRHAPRQRVRHRRPLALQGGHARRPRLRRQAGLGAPAHGMAARRLGRHRVHRGRQARHLPGPGLRLHPQGRRQGHAGRRHAARLRLPHPHRGRPRLHRRQGQQPPRAARLQAQERRHRRDRDHEERPRAIARLAQHRDHEPRAREDPPMVQAPAARREHHPRPAAPRPRAAPPGPHLAREDRPPRRSRTSSSSTT